ncbi:MAG: hypothetical protein WCA32_01360 [Chromatiaceae bacterium]|jgi:hypothetical protein
MSHPFDHAAFEDCILSSSDDYEPYGFQTPHLATVASVQRPSEVDARFGIHARAIEADLLDNFDSVGC